MSQAMDFEDAVGCDAYLFQGECPVCGAAMIAIDTGYDIKLDCRFTRYICLSCDNEKADLYVNEDTGVILN